METLALWKTYCWHLVYFLQVCFNSLFSYHTQFCILLFDLKLQLNILPCYCELLVKLIAQHCCHIMLYFFISPNGAMKYFSCDARPQPGFERQEGSARPWCFSTEFQWQRGVWLWAVPTLEMPDIIFLSLWELRTPTHFQISLTETGERAGRGYQSVAEIQFLGSWASSTSEGSFAQWKHNNTHRIYSQRGMRLNHETPKEPFINH